MLFFYDFWLVFDKAGSVNFSYKLTLGAVCCETSSLLVEPVDVIVLVPARATGAATNA